MNTERFFRIVLILIVALSVAAIMAVVQISREQAKNHTAAGNDGSISGGVGGIALGGPFSLHDQTGKVFTQKDFLGKLTLLYFGFTSCPAICPTELQKINVAVSRLGPAGEKVQQVFITVDPDRDTPAVMAPYVKQFNARLIGLTGTQGEIDRATSAFHVYARKVTEPNTTAYTMDHSSYIYLIGADGKIISLYGPSSTAEAIAKAVKAQKSF